MAIVERDVALKLIDTVTRAELSLGVEAEDATSLSWNPNVDTVPPNQLVFSANGRLHKASALGGYLGELAGANDTNSAQVMPAWGSDKRIVYARGRASAQRDWALTGACDLMIVDEGGGTPVPLAGASGDGFSNYYPAYSPDAQWIAFTHSELGTTYSAADAELRLVKSDGSGVVRALPMINAIGASRSYPAWSLDGNYLGFSVSTNLDRYDWDIYLAPIDPESGIEMGEATAIEGANTAGFEHGVEWSK